MASILSVYLRVSRVIPIVIVQLNVAPWHESRWRGRFFSFATVLRCDQCGDVNGVGGEFRPNVITVGCSDQFEFIGHLQELHECSEAKFTEWHGITFLLGKKRF